MTNSKRKGKVGEQSFCHFIQKAWGVSARRSQQYCGSSDSADIQTSIKGVHFEVKRTEAFRIYDAIDQATADCGVGSVPVVAYRRNRGEWLLVLKAKDAILFSKKMLANETALENSGIFNLVANEGQVLQQEKQNV